MRHSSLVAAIPLTAKQKGKNDIEMCPALGMCGPIIHPHITFILLFQFTLKTAFVYIPEFN